MANLTDMQKKEITQSLKDRGALQTCPRCGNSHFILVDGFITHYLQPNAIGVTLGGLSMPCVAVVCNNCGFLSEHSLGILGLLRKYEDLDSKKADSSELNGDK
jgi:ribosomal protein S27AE